jgi:hypothetical protein
MNKLDTKFVLSLYQSGSQQLVDRPFHTEAFLVKFGGCLAKLRAGIVIAKKGADVGGKRRGIAHRRKRNGPGRPPLRLCEAAFYRGDSLAMGDGRHDAAATAANAIGVVVAHHPAGCDGPGEAFRIGLADYDGALMHRDAIRAAADDGDAVGNQWPK